MRRRGVGGKYEKPRADSLPGIPKTWNMNQDELKDLKEFGVDSGYLTEVEDFNGDLRPPPKPATRSAFMVSVSAETVAFLNSEAGKRGTNRGRILDMLVNGVLEARKRAKGAEDGNA